MAFRSMGTSKQGVDQDKNAEKRQEAALSLRKQKRNQQLEQKRARQQNPEDDAAAAADEPLPRVDELPLWVKEMANPDPVNRKKAVSGIRRLLSTTENPPVMECLAVPEALPVLDALMKDTAHPDIQFEAAWALTNIASGSTEATRMAQVCIPALGQLMQSPVEDLREQAVWAIGNFSAERDVRDTLLQEGYMGLLINVVSGGNPRITTLRTATWAMTNLCRGKPIPQFHLIKGAIPVFAQMLMQSSDEEMLQDAAWGLSYICDGDAHAHQAVIDSNVLPRVLALLSWQQSEIQTATLRMVGNIVSGTEGHTQEVLNKGLLPKLHFLFESSSSAIRKSVLWTLSNITAGTVAQLQAVIQSGVFRPVISSLEGDTAIVKNEAAWVVCNAACMGTPEQVKFLLGEGCVQPLVNCLKKGGGASEKTIKVALDALDKLMRKGEIIAQTSGGTNPTRERLVECGGVDAIEDLVTPRQRATAIYEKAEQFITTHFEVEREMTEDVDFDLNVAAGAGGEIGF
eukprot:TRINITY_DN599_c0_g1_i1.p1 TRINITY_DN599_c0_g1~~TRINITY_DN599_c0_g1_i1.p1  ORF type:complete len:515 (+),score=216.44 TRINITY_DN599_c0_g1_i1:55-1599(+)